MSQIVFDFAKNKEELTPEYEAKLVRYLQENSAEKGQGYIDACIDIIKELDFILYKPFIEGYCLPRTPHIVKTSLTKFHISNFLALENLNKKGTSDLPNISPE